VELRRGRRVGRGPAAELVGLNNVARGLRLVRGPARRIALETSWGVTSNNIGRGFDTWWAGVTWRITWRMMWQLTWRVGVSDAVVNDDVANDVALVGPTEYAKSCLLRQLACFLQPGPIITKLLTLSSTSNRVSRIPQAECPGYHLQRSHVYAGALHIGTIST